MSSFTCGDGSAGLLGEEMEKQIQQSLVRVGFQVLSN